LVPAVAAKGCATAAENRRCDVMTVQFLDAKTHVIHHARLRRIIALTNATVAKRCAMVGEGKILVADWQLPTWHSRGEWIASDVMLTIREVAERLATLHRSTAHQSDRRQPDSRRAEIEPNPDR